MRIAGARSALGLMVLGATWLAAVGAGMGVLAAYDHTPGTPAAPPSVWPPASAIARVPGIPTLILFAHPQCPCSRASVHELAEIMASVPGHLSAHVLFLKPAPFEPAWAQTDLWASATAIPGVTVALDDRGTEARSFGAVTSGQVVLYDTNGVLRFAGGLTSARGREGDSAGRRAILALLTRGIADRRDAAVFGCSLLDPAPPTSPGSRR